MFLRTKIIASGLFLLMAPAYSGNILKKMRRDKSQEQNQEHEQAQKSPPDDPVLAALKMLHANLEARFGHSARSSAVGSIRSELDRAVAEDVNENLWCDFFDVLSDEYFASHDAESAKADDAKLMRDTFAILREIRQSAPDLFDDFIGAIQCRSSAVEKKMGVLGYEIFEYLTSVAKGLNHLVRESHGEDEKERARDLRRDFRQLERHTQCEARRVHFSIERRLLILIMNVIARDRKSRSHFSCPRKPMIYVGGAVALIVAASFVIG
ncbi:hypothetical protein HOD08_05305, partial [bacterium]|nr:hypothetical protein [bacterium]